MTFSDNTTKTYNLSQTNVNVAYNDLSKFTVLKNDDNIFFTANSPLIPDGEVIRVAMKGKDSASAFEFNVTVATVANKTQFYIPWAALPDGTYDITFASPSGSNPYYSGVLAKDYVNKNSGVNPNPVDPGNEQTPSGGGSGGGCDAGFGAFALVLASGAAMALRKKK
ncbi:hypothetical protein FACS1894216_14930 [Synergistales bacterium]|nr:hypothetical protein FACS1894216_14930 [Synergistales bacterium]